MRRLRVAAAGATRVGGDGPDRRGLAGLALWMLLLGLACDDSITPEPPKAANLAPDTFLAIQSDSLATVFYKLPMRWLGSDADGKVVGYRFRWVCEDLGGPACPADSVTQTTATGDTFALYVPLPTARYRFEVAAVDNQGLVDPTPATQEFHFYNTAPVVDFQPGSKPASTLPAVTFYLQAVDPDSTPDPADHDSHTDLAQFRAWLDGNEPAAHAVPYSDGAVTFAPEDFQGRYGTRTVFIQAIDDGGAVSATVSYPWEVVAPPARGILLVDDCTMGQNLAVFSDQSYRNVLATNAPGRYVVLNVDSIPRLSSQDLDATLSLFDRVVWYTDADTQSSGALELARGGLDALLARQGHLFLGSGLAFGTNGAFGDQEARFRDWFGIETFFQGPDGSTNFAFSLVDTVQAAVQPGLTKFTYVSLGIGSTLRCFRSRQEATTRSLYYYPPGTFVRNDSSFVNPEQFDIGVAHQLTGGGATVYVSFPIGLPINANVGENEIEIREMLRLAGILDP